VSQTVAQPQPSRFGRWLAERRLKIALTIAVLEGILVAFAKGWSTWTIIIISAPVIAFYVFAGRTLSSDTGRQLSWIAAATQAFAVLLCVVVLAIGAFGLIVAGVFAAIAVYLILGDRPNRPGGGPSQPASPTQPGAAPTQPGGSPTQSGAGPTQIADRPNQAGDGSSHTGDT
jgi:hypothetical protein